jgi:hypothetical protein
MCTSMSVRRLQGLISPSIIGQHVDCRGNQCSQTPEVVFLDVRLGSRGALGTLEATTTSGRTALETCRARQHLADPGTSILKALANQLRPAWPVHASEEF